MICSGERLVKFAKQLRNKVSGMKFASPVACVYNPLDYAWAAHELYLRRFGGGSKRVIFLGMNPGPFGMAQTGVPFGEITAVRNWLRIHAPVGKPLCQHPKRPVTGFDCTRSEVSGRRLWNFFAAHFGSPEKFFEEHFVVNYCPLVFMEDSGRNLTPDKLPNREREILFAACDEHLRDVVQAVSPQWIVGIGGFAEKRARIVFPRNNLKIGCVLHPSPASPAANRDWARLADSQLRQLGVWK
jgi:single-strand selective monofunctional uracil DNA glycosylase